MLQGAVVPASRNISSVDYLQLLDESSQDDRSKLLHNVGLVELLFLFTNLHLVGTPLSEVIDDLAEGMPPVPQSPTGTNPLGEYLALEIGQAFVMGKWETQFKLVYSTLSFPLPNYFVSANALKI